MNRMIAVSTALTILCGCQSIPETKIGINPSTKQFSVRSPKEIEADNLDITLPDGAHFHADKLSSKNSPDVITAVAAANALQIEKTTKLIERTTALVETLGAKIGTGGVGP